MLRSRFAGVGAALPSHVVGNAEIESRLGVEPGWIEGRTGVRERRIVSDAEPLLDLAERAARDAIAAAGIAPQAIDAIVVATTSAPYLFPSLGCLLHARLGLAFQPAFDVAAACAGFPYALTVADQAIRAGDHERVLVVGADCLSTYCDPLDRVTVPLFGDGAGAAVLSQRPDPGRRSIAWHAFGSLTNPAERDALKFETQHGMLRNILTRPVPRLAADHAQQVLQRVLDAAGLAPDDIAAWIMHAGGRDVLLALQKTLQLDDGELRYSAAMLREYGNMSSAFVYYVLQAALRDNAPPGWWWMSSFGAGFSCHGALLEAA